MEYQKIINLLDNTSNKPSKFRAKNLVEITDDWRRAYNNNIKIEFKTAMLNSSWCDDSKAIFNKFAPFVTEINSIRMLM